MIQRKKHVTVLLQSKDQEVTMILFPDLFAWGGSHICFWLRLCCFSHISSVGGWEGKVEPSPAPCSCGRMQKRCHPEFVLPLPSFLTVQATRPGAQGAWHQSQSGLPWKSYVQSPFPEAAIGLLHTYSCLMHWKPTHTSKLHHPDLYGCWKMKNAAEVRHYGSWYLWHIQLELRPQKSLPWDYKMNICKKRELVEQQYWRYVWHQISMSTKCTDYM